jgi:hypothetical protein
LGELLTTNAGALPLAGVLVLQPTALDVSDIDRSILRSLRLRRG